MPVKSTMMKTVKQYRYVLAAVTVLAVLVLIRAFNPGIFRYNAAKWAEPSVTGENIMTAGELSTAGEGLLIVLLDESFTAPEVSGAAVIAVDPQAILADDNLRKIRKNSGPVVLCAEDNSVSARVWMVLSEMGIKNLYILK